MPDIAWRRQYWLDGNVNRCIRKINIENTAILHRISRTRKKFFPVPHLHPHHLDPMRSMHCPQHPLESAPLTPRPRVPFAERKWSSAVLSIGPFRRYRTFSIMILCILPNSVLTEWVSCWMEKGLFKYKSVDSQLLMNVQAVDKCIVVPIQCISLDSPTISRIIFQAVSLLRQRLCVDASFLFEIPALD